MTTPVKVLAAKTLIKGKLIRLRPLKEKHPANRIEASRRKSRIENLESHFPRLTPQWALKRHPTIRLAEDRRSVQRACGVEPDLRMGDLRVVSRALSIVCSRS